MGAWFQRKVPVLHPDEEPLEDFSVGAKLLPSPEEIVLPYRTWFLIHKISFGLCFFGILITARQQLWGYSIALFFIPLLVHWAYKARNVLIDRRVRESRCLRCGQPDITVEPCWICQYLNTYKMRPSDPHSQLQVLLGHKRACALGEELVCEHDEPEKVSQAA
jgi:hypothetical protein